MKLLKYISTLGITSLAVAAITSCNKTDVDSENGGTTYYVSPDGAEDGTGSKDNPLNIRYGLSAGKNPGDVVIIQEGNYKLDYPVTLLNYGTKEAPITVKAEGKVVIDFSGMEFLSTNRGITVSGNYYYIEGLEIMGAGDNGMYISGSYNVVDNCVFHDNRDTGLQLGRGGSSMATMDLWPSNNLIKNCTSYGNFDDQTGGENADGFAAKLTVGYGNVFDSCIAYRNSDDGWDLFAKQDSGNIGRVILYNCVSFENGYLYTKESEVDINNNPTTDPAYNTTLGDGIGFKLGGSIMKGDVLMYNCLAFNNKLHGVGDNSNPGVISVYNTTTYNNCAQLDENTGKIDASLKLPDGETASANFSLARTENSYNTYSGLLSYANNASLGADEYRGLAYNSLFNTGSNYKLIEDYMDASSYVESKAGTIYENGLSDSSFKSVTAPSGLENPNIHTELRNEDGSVNIGDFLSLTDETLSKLNNGSPIGATLNKSSWEEYEHYNLEIDPSLSTNEAVLMAGYMALELTCNPNAVTQDFKLPVKYNGIEVLWKSSDPNVLEVGSEVIESNSGSKEIVIKVNRPEDKDTKVTLTATLIYNEIEIDETTFEEIIKDTVSTTKTFEVNVKQEKPELGEVEINSDSKVILDKYAYYVEPGVSVYDASNYSGKLLTLGKDYSLEKEIIYKETKTSEGKEVPSVYTSTPGIYEVTYKAISTLNQAESSASYTVYVVDPNAEIELLTSSLYVNRDGYNLVGELSNVKANVYILVSDSIVNDVNTVIAEGEKFVINDDIVDLSGINDNSKSYYVNVVIENSGQTIKSEVISKQVNYVEITNEQEFYNLMSGNTSNNSSTIYSLTNDLDYVDFTWNPNAKNVEFEGLLNGNGHTISNITIHGTDKDRLSVINRLQGGTIMNVNFNNISIKDITEGKPVAERVGLIGRSYGGYVHNVKINNIELYGYRRVGLIGHVSAGDTYISLVEIYNDDNHIITAYNNKDGQDIGGLIGLVQNDSSVTEMLIDVDNCYVNTDLGSGDNRYTAGVIGRADDRIEGMTINVNQVIYEGTQKVDNYAGGIINFTTGISQINITKCAVNITTYKQGNKLLICEKNNSSITGRFAINSGNGYTNITQCYGTLGEYNADASNDISYGVTKTYAEFFGPDAYDMEVVYNMIELDMENVWQLLQVGVDEDGTTPLYRFALK